MYLVGAIVLVVILLIYIGSSRANTLNEYMTGVWIATPEFCEESEVESLMIVLDTPVTSLLGSSSRIGYIVATPDMINTAMTLKYSRGYAVSPHEYRVNATVEFDEGELWDKNITISVNMLYGGMKIYSKDTLYASMYKNHEVSESVLANLAAD